MKLKKISYLLTLLFIMSFSLFAKEVNIYSYRQEFLIKPLLDAFTDKTGIKANVVYAKSGVAERLKREGKNSQADVVLTVSVGVLNEFVENKTVQKIKSSTVIKNVPKYYRENSNYWVGLTTRARIIYASKTRVKPGAITTYEDLANSRWKGKVCSRPFSHVYNLDLTAYMVVKKGKERTEKWLKGIKRNLARKPQGNDRAQVKAIKEGICDIGIGNSYYYGKMITNAENPEQIEWAKSINVVYPNQKSSGSHVNLSGILLAKYAPNKKNALRLINFLTSDLAQYMYAQVNFEYPIKKGVPPSPLLEKDLNISSFKRDKVALSKVAKARKTAQMLINKVGIDN